MLAALLVNATVKKRPGVSVYAYVNNFGILAKGKTVCDTIGKAALVFETVSMELKRIGIVFVPNKIVFLPFWKGNVLITGLLLPSETCKYLGCILDRTLSFAEYVRDVRKRSAKTTGFVRRLKKCGGMPTKYSAALVRTYVVPVLLYGSEV